MRQGLWKLQKDSKSRSETKVAIKRKGQENTVDIEVVRLTLVGMNQCHLPSGEAMCRDRVVARGTRVRNPCLTKQEIMLIYTHKAWTHRTLKITAWRP